MNSKIYFFLNNQLHRVIVPKDSLGRRSARQSIAVFLHPDNEVLIPVTLLNDNNNHVQTAEWTKAVHFLRDYSAKRLLTYTEQS